MVLKRKWKLAVILSCMLTLVITPVMPLDVAQATSNKLTLTPSMVTNETGYYDAGQLVDEQTLSGDPAAGTGGNPTTVWNPGSAASGRHPGGAYIDLGRAHNITDIYLYDAAGQGDFRVYAGAPGNWELLITDPLNTYNTWHGYTVDIDTRYIRIERDVASSNMAEIVLYGSLITGEHKLPLSTDWIINESGYNDATDLINEQVVAGDPASGSGGSPVDVWTPGYTAGRHPAGAYIDLSGTFNISKIYLYDVAGQGDFKVYAGSPDNWTLLVTDPLNTYNTWKEHLVNVDTQFIRIERTSNDANMAEIVLYGSYVGPSDTTPPADITDFTATPGTSGSVDLTWTAPGDDGTTGTASSYDIRYSTRPINKANFTDATQAVSIPMPSSAGSSESMTVSGLAANTTYYFALMTVDDADNTSFANYTGIGGGQVPAMCDLTIPSDTQLTFDGSVMGADPGDVVCIAAGQRPEKLKLVNFHGTAADPITFINYGGQVIIENTNASDWWTMKIDNSSHFRLTGTGDPDYMYGFQLSLDNNSRGAVFEAKEKSTNYEIDHVSIVDSKNGYNGFSLKTHPSCDGSSNRDTFTQYDTYLHDNYVEAVNGEGIYLGSSWYHEGDLTDCDGDDVKETPLLAHEIHGLRIYNNIILDTGRDAIQVGSATQDVEVYDNIIENYATRGNFGHRSGIQINPGTAGKFYNNYIDMGTFGDGEAAVGNFGRGDVEIFNNVMVEPIFGVFSADRVDENNPIFDGSPMHIWNNTIIRPVTDGIRFRNTEALNNTIRNNVIVHPMADGAGRKYINLDAVGVDMTESNNYETQKIQDPKFVKASRDNYHLKPGSTLINAGYDLTGQGVTFDFDYNTRPAGGVDIGAFEYVAP